MDIGVGRFDYLTQTVILFYIVRGVPMSKVDINQAAPVCPGCRRTIGGVKFVSKQVKFEDDNETMIMVALCCSNEINGHPCNMTLKFDVISDKNEPKIIVPEKPNITVVH